MDTQPVPAGNAGRHGDGPLRDRLRRALPQAMRARDVAAVAALRSALAAIDNAEAVDAGQAPQPAPEGAPPDGQGPPGPAPGVVNIAGTVAGLGAAEVARRDLTEAEVAAIVRAEVAERLAAAAGYQRAGQHERAERLRAEADLLSRHLDGAAPP